MKTITKVTLAAAATLASISSSAQPKGRFEAYDCDNFKLHVYYSNDVMGDASYIIEGKDGLVAMEYPLFKENAAEFENYIGELKKPVVQIITDYHEGASGSHSHAMAQGMPTFMKGEIYGGMMAGFKQAFGESMVDLPTGKAVEIPFGSKQKWAGVEFRFERGASTDFPAASIIIGTQVYYTHWTPAKAHVSHLQVSSVAAIEAEIAEAEKSLSSGAELFIGGHGGAANRDAVEFKIAYLNRMKELVAANNDANRFIDAMKQAYPNLPGESGLNELAKALYRD